MKRDAWDGSTAPMRIPCKYHVTNRNTCKLNTWRHGITMTTHVWLDDVITQIRTVGERLWRCVRLPGREWRVSELQFRHSGKRPKSHCQQYSFRPSLDHGNYCSYWKSGVCCIHVLVRVFACMCCICTRMLYLHVCAAFVRVADVLCNAISRPHEMT